MKIACYNHYPAPLAYEPGTMQKRLKKVWQTLLARDLILPHAHTHTLDELEFNLVDDATITDLHAQFMDDPTPTDVITFHHGEVFVSYDTAQREASERAIPLQEELYRYHLHGLLHLAGYDDLTPAEHQQMHTLQEALIAEQA